MCGRRRHGGLHALQPRAEPRQRLVRCAALPLNRRRQRLELPPQRRLPLAPLLLLLLLLLLRALGRGR